MEYKLKGHLKFFFHRGKETNLNSILEKNLNLKKHIFGIADCINNPTTKASALLPYLKEIKPNENVIQEAKN